MEQDKNSRAVTIMAVVSLVALTACLVPLLLINQYNHSFADDWFYGVNPHLALEAGEGVLGAMRAAAEKVAYTYETWQGTYSAIFVMSMYPGIFGEEYYVLCAPIVLALLLGSNFFLAKVVLGELAGQKPKVWVCVAAVVSTVQLLCQQSSVEGIFWYNAAVYYTGYHGLAQILAGLMLRMSTPDLPRGKRQEGQSRPRGQQVALVLACALLSAFLAGGNFVTMVECLEGVVILIVFLLLWGKRREALCAVPSLVLQVVGVAISLAAPGNSARGSGQFEGRSMGVVDTLVGSFAATFTDAASWVPGFAAVAVLALLPLALFVARRTTLSYRSPWLATIGCLGVMYSCYTPTFWGMGYVGPGRCQNIRYDLFVVMLMLNLFWWAGWFVRRREDREAFVRRLDGGAKAGLAVFGVACAIGLGIFGYGVANHDFGEQIMPLSATRSLLDGNAVEYDRQVRDRWEYLATTEDAECEVAYYTAGPKVLFMGDVREDMSSYMNYHLAKWFHKDAILGVHGNP